MRALRGMPFSGCAGIFCTSPLGLYSQPWYGQTMQSPLTLAAGERRTAVHAQVGHRDDGAVAGLAVEHQLLARAP